MPDEYTETEEFRGATFRGVDLSGAALRECDVTGVRIIGSVVDDLEISAFAGRLGRVVVEGVEVTAYVETELARRFPERARLREARTIEDHQALWRTVDELWAEMRRHAEQEPDERLYESVDGEWSFVQTLRHLVFAIDLWIGRMLQGEPQSFHRWGLPTTDFPVEGGVQLGLDVAATPTYSEVAAVHDERRASVTRALAALTDDELAQMRTAVVTVAWGEESRSVARCLQTVLNEHIEHRRYALRDLAILAAR